METGRTRTEHRHWWTYLAAGAGVGMVLAVAAVVAALILGRPKVSVSESSQALAQVHVSGLDAMLSGVQATSAGRSVSLVRADGGFVPAHRLAQGQEVRVTASVAPPSWLRWLVGPGVSATTTVRTPNGSPALSVALASSARKVPVRFDRAVSVVDYRFTGSPMRVLDLHRPATVVDLSPPSASSTGSLQVSAAPLSWEAVGSHAVTVTWFVAPPGGGPVAAASPAPGSSTAAPDAPITINFSQPVAKVLGTARPSLSPAVPGAWTEPAPDTLRFTPSGFGFDPGTTVTVAFDRAVSIIGAKAGATTTASSSQAASSSYHFIVAPGSVLRLEQILASLHYLPLRFVAAPGVSQPTTLAAEEASISHPLAGSFSWRWASTPASLRAQWVAGSPNLVLKGALMAFDSTLGNYDGYTLDAATVAQLANASTWDALLQAAVAHRNDPSGYSYVQVSQAAPETLTLWENGSVVLTSQTNTGIAQDPTANGTFPIYLRYVQRYMNGTNPDGSTYHDLVHWINYFNGGDAVHGFLRASYGARQSLGCAELPLATAQVAFGHLAIGDLVTVTG